MTEILIPPEVSDASESSWENPHFVRQHPPEREAYITVDTLENLMSIMIDTILQQVTEQVKKTMEVVNSARPLPTFDYVPTARCELSHWNTLMGSHHRSGKARETARLESDGRSGDENRDRSIGVVTPWARRVTPGWLAKFATTSMPYVTHSRKRA